MRPLSGMMGTILVMVFLALPFLYWSCEAHPDAGLWEIWNLNHGVFLEILLFMAVVRLLTGTGRPGRWLGILAVLLVPLILTAQFMHLYFAGSEFGEVTLDHADQVALVVSQKSVALSLLYPLDLFVVLIWMRRCCRTSRWSVVGFLLVLAVVLALPPHLLPQLFHGEKDQDPDYHWPVVEFVQVLERHFLGAGAFADSGEVDIELAQAYGFDFLTDGGVRPRKRVYETEFPYPRKLPKGETPPNVIVLFVESLSARMVGAYGMRESSVTPNLDDFARGAMRVEGYVNHTTPTVPGLFGQICSVYPPYKAEMKGVKPDPNMECLPHILAREAGYRTVYFSHSHPKYAGIGKLLEQWGFEETYLWRRLLKNYLQNEPPYLGAGGLSDHQMMRGLVNYLERERQHLLGEGRPFFIGLSTVETHTGRTANDRDGVPLDDSATEVDNAFHSMDDAFGHFWRYFRDSPYADNTIVIVTADHARFPSLDYKEVAGKGYIPSVYDEVALLIRDPFHELPQELKLRASTLDFAPSLYHLLGAEPRRANRMMGLSIFGDRQRYAGIVSLSAYRQFGYMVVDGDGKRRRKSFHCDQARPLCNRDTRLIAIVRHLQALVKKHRYW